MQLVVLIPHYNHSATIGMVVHFMRNQGWPVLIVDDGSDESEHQVLHELASQDGIEIIWRSSNAGKGAAMKCGFRIAAERGYSHVLQIDADAQHRFTDAALLVSLAQQHPQAVICAQPVYDRHAPKARLYGRKITNFWNYINTGTHEIRDGMCGFRVYPLAAVLPVLSDRRPGNRMDFDIEILVRLVWRHVPLLWHSTPVSYQHNGISHFRGWQDNWLISKMHARLFFGRLAQLLGIRHD